MERRPLNIGPVRSSHGVADVRFDGVELVLTRYADPVSLLARYRAPVLAVALICGLGAVSFDGVVCPVLLGVGCVVALPPLLLTVAEAVAEARGQASFADGLRRARSRHDGADLVVLETDIRLMDPVQGAVRPRLVLHTGAGELTLSGWPWRRRQLERLEAALAR